MNYLQLHHHYHHHCHFVYWCHPPNRLIMTLLIQVCCSYDTSVNSHNSKVQGKNLHVSFLPPSVELVHSLVKRVERLESQCTLLTNHVLMMQLVSERFPVVHIHVHACFGVFILGTCITQFSSINQSFNMVPITTTIRLTVSTKTCFSLNWTKYSSTI